MALQTYRVDEGPGKFLDVKRSFVDQ